MTQNRNRKIGFVFLATVFGSLLLASLSSYEVAYAKSIRQALPSEGEIPDVSDIVRGFDPPPQDWLPGHRGIDLASSPGAPVIAVRTGTVYFSGQVARVGVVSIDHGDGTRTTYQPVTPSVTIGQQVSTGQEIGKLNSGHCLNQACLHLGYLRGDQYLDPSVLLVQTKREVRLLASDASPNPHLMTLASNKQSANRYLDLPRGDLPVSGPVTSHFGMRFHPITGAYQLHDGVDLGASCGTPVILPWPGRVRSVTFDSAWGHRVVVDHGLFNGQQITSSYNHLVFSPSLQQNQLLARGAQVGQVGSTGYSTGCHLHWGVEVDGKPVDPLGVAGPS